MMIKVELTSFGWRFHNLTPTGVHVYVELRNGFTPSYPIDKAKIFSKASSRLMSNNKGATSDPPQKLCSQVNPLYLFEIGFEDFISDDSNLFFPSFFKYLLKKRNLKFFLHFFKRFSESRSTL